MTVNILAFGIVKDIFKNSSIHLEVEDGIKIHELKNQLEDKYPRLASLKSFVIAVNDEYSNADDIIKQHDEIAIIPPVSGG